MDIALTDGMEHIVDNTAPVFFSPFCNRAKSAFFRLGADFYLFRFRLLAAAIGNMTAHEQIPPPDSKKHNKYHSRNYHLFSFFHVNPFILAVLLFSDSILPISDPEQKSPFVMQL